MADHTCTSIDEDRLEEWVELFTDDCTYKILSRENVERRLSRSKLLSCHNN